jgi:SAM-dependent methyltransferase
MLKALVRAVVPARFLAAWGFRRAERQVADAVGETPPHLDGLALPPSLLRVLVAGSADAEWFLRHGEAQASTILAMAASHGASLDAPTTVFEFGCGCGRLARWIAPQAEAGGGAFTGSDLNPALVGWCADNLPGDYVRNRLKPPLPLAGASQDLAYAYSVVTHLTRPVTEAWLGEIARVLKPGGLALISFHDEDFRAEAMSDALRRDGYVVNTTLLEGSNHMAAFTTRACFAELSAPWFDVEDIRKSDPASETQAWAILRRRSSKSLGVRAFASK